MSRSKEGFVTPHSMFPMVPLDTSQSSANLA